MPKTGHIKCTRIYVSVNPGAVAVKTAYAPVPTGSVEQMARLASRTLSSRLPTLPASREASKVKALATGSKTTRQPTRWYAVLCVSDFLAAKATPTEACEMNQSLGARTLRPIPQGVGSNLGG